MSRKIPLIAIVGRTNVGKSTLFNAIAGRKISVVEDTPGVTRDRIYTYVTRFGAPFTLVDTGGLAGEQEKLLADSVRVQTQVAIQESDLVIAVFDGIQGVHPYDSEIVKLLRASAAGKPIIWLINKCERPSTELLAADFYSLGIPEVDFVSAAHHKGVKELVQMIKTRLELVDPDVNQEAVELPALPVRITIVGKPNVGKSTLVNKIVGEERVIASELAGTTRDAIEVKLTHEGKEFILVDTAGLRRKNKVEDMTIERFSNLRTLKGLVGADVAVLVLDATQGLPTEQDAKIAGLIHERGRAFIIVVNKWDLVEKNHRSVKDFEDAIYSVFKFAPYAPIIFTSALSGRRCFAVLAKAAEVYESARTRIKTADLNRILDFAFTHKPPPVYRGEPIKLFFATQIEVAPPTFVLFVNHPKRLNYSYERYIKNSLRKEYPFPGSDIKIIFRKKTEKSARADEGGRAER